MYGVSEEFLTIRARNILKILNDNYPIKADHLCDKIGIGESMGLYYFLEELTILGYILNSNPEFFKWNSLDPSIISITLKGLWFINLKH